MRIGILGSMVWDRIDHPDAPRVERWGGIAYSLAAAAAALPAGWSIRPIVQVGRDLADEAATFFRTVPGLDTGVGVRVVDEPNNRVHLRYRDREHRHECLTGGVPPWRWSELEPRLDGLDALFINLISGFELELETAERLQARFPGPVYADLHSLLLGVADGGHREPRPLRHRDRWLAAFDVVQVNERELALVAGGADGADGAAGAPVRVAEAAVRAGLGALLVTRGAHGATWIADADRAYPWRTEPPRAVRQGHVPVADPWRRGDPTGCGDVWGATCFLALARGERLTAAMAAANRAAARNVAHRGADGLYQHLRADS